MVWRCVCIFVSICCNKQEGERRERKRYREFFPQTSKFFQENTIGKVLFLKYVFTKLGRGTRNKIEVSV